MSELAKYKEAVLAIKNAILQSRYQAAKAANSEQLMLYYGIGVDLGKVENPIHQLVTDELQPNIPPEYQSLKPLLTGVQEILAADSAYGTEGDS
jgi:hypothetical protein